MKSRPIKLNRKLNRKPVRTDLGSCNIGDIVIHNGKQVYVQHVLDYDTDFKKSYIKCCLMDESGKPMTNTDILVGYDWVIFSRNIDKI